MFKTANAGLSWVAQGGRSLEQPCLPFSSQHKLHKARRPSKSIWVSNCPNWFTTAQKHLCWHQPQGQTKLLLQSLQQSGATMNL